MIEDLTMLANLPVCEEEAEDKKEREQDGETMPPPREKDRTPEDNTKAERVTRRGQDAPKQER